MNLFRLSISLFSIFIINFLCASEIDEKSNPNLPSSTQRLKISNHEDKIGLSFWRKSEKETKKSIDDLYQIGVNEKDQYAIAIANLSYAKYFEKQQDIEKAKHYADLALKYFVSTNDKLGICKTLRQQGFNAFKASNIELALELAYKALSISESINDKKQEGLCLSQLGLLLFGAQAKEGIDLHKKGFELLIKCGAKREASISAVTLSTLYLNSEDVTTAKHYIDTFFVLQEELNDNGLLAEGKINASLIQLALGNTELAEKLLDECGDYFTLLRSDVSQAKFCRLKSVFYRDSGRFKEAIEAAEKGLFLLGNKEGLDNEKGMLNYTLFVSYKALKQYEKAIDAYEQAVNHEFILFDQQAQLGIADVKEKYETEKKEQENVELRHKDEINQLKISRSYYLIAGGIVFFLLLGLIFILIHRNGKIKARERNIQLQQRLLVSQMNPHFIFNSLNSIQNFIYKQDALTASSYLSRFAELMRMILNYSRKDLITVDEEITLLDSYLSIQKLRFGENLEWEIYCSEKIIAESVLIPPMLAQPFIENALEHGLFKDKEHGKITLSFEKMGDQLILTIIDNGIGMKSKNDKVVKHESLALKITEERIKGMNEINKLKTKFELINLSDVDVSQQGIKVVFKIPFLSKF